MLFFRSTDLNKHLQKRVFFCLLLLWANDLLADELNVAVASNFSYALKLLADDFNRHTGHELRISSASTGKLYTQIRHGAPFDVFLAADEKRPDLLIAENLADQSSAYVYAIGQLILLSNIYPEGDCQSVLTAPALKRFAIANPKTAPYGVAAKQVLERMALWTRLQPLIVKGENAAQTLQFVSTKNAQAGFVAKSMLNMGVEIASVCTWDIPADMYSPIKQKMVVLNRAKDKPAAQAFSLYMQSARAKKIVKASGFEVL
jgi:molybdate transport system substrate-binding protein